MSLYAQLTNDLKDEGVSMQAVRINETPQDNTFCILNYGSEIETFYFERGSKFELKRFTDEKTAISSFKEWVLSHPHIRVGWDGRVRSVNLPED